MPSGLRRRGWTLFQTPDFWRIFFGDEGWFSTVVEIDDNYLLNIGQPLRIGTTGQFDFEPWFGYPAPFATTCDRSFLVSAYAEYQDIARDRAWTAELIRFEPIPTRSVFEDLPAIRVVTGRSIAYAQLFPSFDRQVEEYSAPCRRMLRSHGDDYSVERVDSTDAWIEFAWLYSDTMERVGAARRWRFGDDVFARIEPSPLCHLYLARRKGVAVSGMMVMGFGTTAYSLMVASRDLPDHPGVNDRLTLDVSVDLARRGFSWLNLGGGRTIAHDDSLLRYKRRFTSHVENAAQRSRRA